MPTIGGRGGIGAIGLAGGGAAGRVTGAMVLGAEVVAGIGGGGRTMGIGGGGGAFCCVTGFGAEPAFGIAGPIFSFSSSALELKNNNDNGSLIIYLKICLVVVNKFCS